VTLALYPFNNFRLVYLHVGTENTYKFIINVEMIGLGYTIFWFKFDTICRAASIPRGKGRACLQMKLVYNKLAPVFLFLFQWMDYSRSCLSVLSTHLNLLPSSCVQG